MIGVVLLAAGASSRLDQPKQLVVYQGKTLLRHTAECACTVGEGPVVVVLGAHAERCLPELEKLAVTPVIAPDWQEGMAASLRAGITAVAACEGALVLLCDQSVLTGEHLRAICATWEPGTIVASDYGPHLGSPCIFDRAFFPELLALTGDQSARTLLQRYPPRTLPFPGGLHDIDTPRDLVHYNVFGSPSSLDFDVMVFVETFGSVQECKEHCAALEQALAHELTGKKVSVNLGVLEEGALSQVFKGLPDECNNSLLATYKFHTQAHPLAITRAVPREIPAKLERTLRVVLSYLSRTEHREPVKRALRGSLQEKQDTLAQIDLAQLPGETTELFKSTAFQLGQCGALLEGVEIYTKEALAEHAPALAPYLQRIPTAGTALEHYKRQFLTQLTSSAL